MKCHIIQHFIWVFTVCKSISSISVYPRNKKGHGNFIKKGTSSARWMIKRGTLCARWGIEKGTFTVFLPLLLPPPPPPPPPTHTHTHHKEILIFSVYILSLLHSQSNNPSLVPSNGCPFLKLPQPKKILCSLFTYMVFVPLKIYHLICSLTAKNVPFPQKWFIFQHN